MNSMGIRVALFFNLFVRDSFMGRGGGRRSVEKWAELMTLRPECLLLHLLVGNYLKWHTASAY